MAAGLAVNVVPMFQTPKANFTPISQAAGGSSSSSSNGGTQTSQTVSPNVPPPVIIGISPNGSTSITTSTTTSTTTNPPAWNNEWLAYAKTAWQFFAPGFGVSPVTGLITGTGYWHSFTDWDLGGYIFAVLSAEKLGLISESGNWGVNYRLQLVLNFLDTRPLYANNLTYQFYDSDTGTVSTSYAGNVGNPTDEGRLLISLYELKVAHPELTAQIEAALNRVNYAYYALQIPYNSTSASFFSYYHYSAIGFELWGFLPQSVSELAPPTSGTILSPEPVLFSILEGVNDMYFTSAGEESYLAQYSWYNTTGTITALGEGEYPTFVDASAPYIYEYVNIPTGSSISVLSYNGINVTTGPEAFVKIGFAFYSIYRSSYGAFLVKELGGLSNSYGFMEGVLTSHNNLVFNQEWDDTNIMIMEACAYAVTTS